MDENQSLHNQNDMQSVKCDEPNNPGPVYTIPGILHYIQHEWARFEIERTQWEVEKAELQARIAFLQGERKGQENLKNDLVRRIKMLEYALKQERAKYHKLKFGTDLPIMDMKAPLEESIENTECDIAVTNMGVNWRQGRQLLRQYLQEIGYTDTIIDIRSNRVKSLLGLNNNEKEEVMQNNLTNALVSMNCTQIAQKKEQQQADTKRNQGQGKPPNIVEKILMDTENSVMSSFDFLSGEQVVDEDDDDDDDEDEDLEDPSLPKIKTGILSSGNLVEDMDNETEEVLNEFSFLSGEDEANDGSKETSEWALFKPGSDSNGTDWSVNVDHIAQLKEQYRRDRGKQKKGSLAMVNFQNSSARNRPLVSGSGMAPPPPAPLDAVDAAALGLSPHVDSIDGNLGLGELAQLTVNNEAEGGFDLSANPESCRKQWSAKYTLRSHFDAIRALVFHPVEPMLITASEDFTLKLWNLQKTIPAKKSTYLDVEPIYTFRGHKAAVLSLVISGDGTVCYSSDLSGHIQGWIIPSPNIDPYETYDPSVLGPSFDGHTDAVGGLSLHPSRPLLASCSSDGSVKIWNIQTKVCTLTISTEEDGKPVSIDFVRPEPCQVVVGYETGACTIYDAESGKVIVKMVVEELCRINRVVSHPTLPITVTAHEDRQIRFWENGTGRLSHAMVAHLDAVTCLAVDSSGIFLLSGSDDCSLRLWNLETKTCVQEITAHRKKFDESLFDVAFHPGKPYIASAGADGLAKVFI
ncbi:striatin-3-like isoform X2 [Artemia franciscana]|uniref:Striatin N-terminal domain-containing protein n=1 Tax=Artemia franciscana TaxID=6661 RepID=A0AA88HIG8_ARTSF|nr:hypothetical protein QYM36_015367 [Artemia franciscana]